MASTSTFTPTINQGGIQSTKKGTDYQVNLLQLFAVESYKNNLEFEIFTEVKQAGKFDDVVYSYKDAGQKKHWRLVQAKQKSKPAELNIESFLKDDNYNLYKYFISVTSNDFKNNFPVCDDLIIVTNNKLRVENLWPYLNFEEISVEDPVFGKSGRNFKFDQTCYQKNLTFLKEFFLAIELLNFTFDNSYDFKLLKYSRDFLDSHIFDATTNTLNFKSSFCDGSDQTLLNFYEVLKFAIDGSLVQIPGYINKDDIKMDLKGFLENFNLSFECAIDYQNFIEDKSRIQTQLEEFMNKLMVIAELDADQINELIFRSLSKILNQNSTKPFHADTLKLMIAGFKDKINKWLETNLKSPIDNSLIESIITEQKIKIICPEIQSKIEEKFINDDTRHIRFSSQSMLIIKDFLNSKRSELHERILVVSVQDNDDFLLCLKIYRLNNSLIYFGENEEETEKCLEIFQNMENSLAVANCTKTILNQQLIEIMKNKENKKLIAITSNGNPAVLGVSCSAIQEPRILCNQLTEESLKSFLDGGFVNFQGQQLRMSDMIDQNSVKSLPLSDVLECEEIYGKPLNIFNESSVIRDMYIPRTLERKIHIKPSIIADHQNNIFKDELVFEESEFHTRMTQNLRVHYLEKFSLDSNFDQTLTLEETLSTTEVIIWKMSNCSVDTLKPYIDEENLTKFSDQDILEEWSRVVIIADIPGVGKTFYLNKIVKELPNLHALHWIIGIDLKTFSNEFKNVSTETDFIKFFYRDILKLKSDFEVAAFLHSLNENGNVQVIFDGFDEVSPNYGHIVIKLIKKLLETKICRIFISTRPQWAQTLENEFFQLKFTFAPFSEEDQKDFLVNLWMKEVPMNQDELRQIGQQIIKLTNKTLSDKEKEFTGIPLITKLIGKFYEDDLKRHANAGKPAVDFIATSGIKGVKLFKLFQHFIDKTMENFLTSKFDFNSGNPALESVVKLIEKLLVECHQKLAFNLIFGDEITKSILSIPSLEFDQNEEDCLIRCGLVYLENGQYKFQHQLYAEFIVTRLLSSKILDVKVLEFLFKVVLTGENYQMIRSFLDSFLMEKDYFTPSVTLILNNVTCLHRAAREVNQFTFEKLFRVLVKNLSPADGTVKEILMTIDAEGSTFIFYYYLYCEDNTNLLELLKDIFNLQFVKKILSFKNKFNNLEGNILMASTWNGNNYLNLLKWIFKNFKKDRGFVKKMLLSVDHLMNGVLHNAISKSSEKSFLEMMKCVHTQNAGNFKELLKLRNKDQQSFLFGYNLSRIEEVNFLSKVLELLRELVGEQLTRDIIYMKDVNGSTFLICLASNLSKAKFNKVFFGFHNWMEMNPGMGLRSFLLEKNKYGRNFLHYLVLNDKKSEAGLALLNILNHIKMDHTEIIPQLIGSQDENGSTILHFFAENSRKSDFPAILDGFCKWIQNNVTDFDLRGFLLQKNKWGRSFVNYIIPNDERNEAAMALTTTLNLLKNEFKMDQEFFTQLLCNKDEVDGTILHFFASKSKSENRFKLFIETFNWMKENITEFDLKKFVLVQNKWKRVFLHYIVKNDEKVKDASDLLNVLDFMKAEFVSDPDVIRRLINTKDENDSTILQYFAENSRKSNFPPMLMEFCKWINENIPDMLLNQYLLLRNKWGRAFLNYIVPNDKWDEASAAMLETFNCLKSILTSTEIFGLLNDSDEFGSTLLVYYASKSSKANFVKILREFHNWVKKNVPRLDLKNFLLRKNKWGRTFLHYIVVDDEMQQASSAIVNTLSFLKKEYQSDPEFITNLINSKDEKNSTVLHYFAENSQKEDFPTIFMRFFEWIKNNIPDFDLKKFLLEKNQWKRTFLYHIRVYDKKNEGAKIQENIMELLKKEFPHDPKFIEKISK